MANIAVRKRMDGADIYYFKSGPEVKTVFYDEEADSVVDVKDELSKDFEVMENSEIYNIVEKEDVPDMVLDVLFS